MGKELIDIERIHDDSVSELPEFPAKQKPPTNHERSQKLPEYLMDYYSKIYSEDTESRALSILSRACKRPTKSGPIIRFELPPRYIEVKSDTTFHENRLYRIKGKVESTGDAERVRWNFEIYRMGKERAKLRLFLPKKYHGKVTVGNLYKVTILSIQETGINREEYPKKIASLVQHGAKWSLLRSKGSETQPNADLQRRTAYEKSVANQSIVNAHSKSETIGKSHHAEIDEWKTVAAWMDTEGYLYTKEGRQRKYQLDIKQTDAEPLKAIQRFLQKQGIASCRIKWRSDPQYTFGGTWELRVHAVKDLDKITSNTEQFLLTSIRRRQYERYRQRRREGKNKVEFSQNVPESLTDSVWVDWKIVATWIDAEGNLLTRERPENQRDYRLEISQKERAPLEALRSFLSDEGIKSKVVNRPHQSYSLLVTTVSDIDKIVSRTQAFILRDDKKLQYERYKNRRTRRPRRGPRPKPFSS